MFGEQLGVDSGERLGVPGCPAGSSDGWGARSTSGKAGGVGGTGHCAAGKGAFWEVGEGRGGVWGEEAGREVLKRAAKFRTFLLKRGANFMSKRRCVDLEEAYKRVGARQSEMNRR